MADSKSPTHDSPRLPWCPNLPNPFKTSLARGRSASASETGRGRGARICLALPLATTTTRPGVASTSSPGVAAGTSVGRHMAVGSGTLRHALTASRVGVARGRWPGRPTGTGRLASKWRPEPRDFIMASACNGPVAVPVAGWTFFSVATNLVPASGQLLLVTVDGRAWRPPPQLHLHPCQGSTRGAMQGTRQVRQGVPLQVASGRGVGSWSQAE